MPAQPAGANQSLLSSYEMHCRPSMVVLSMHHTAAQSAPRLPGIARQSQAHGPGQVTDAVPRGTQGTMASDRLQSRNTRLRSPAARKFLLHPHHLLMR